MTPQGREVLRWGLSLGVVVSAHLGGAAALLAWRIPHDPPAAPPAVMLELAPLASAPAPDENEAPPGPKQEVSEPPPVDPEIVEKMLPDPEPPEPIKMPEPIRLADLLPPPVVPPEVVIEVPPPEPPKPRPKPPEVKPKQAVKPTPRKPDPDRKPPAKQTTAPVSAPLPTAQAAAPPPGVASRPSPDVVKRWQATLLAHLQRYKRYPHAAQRNNIEGIAYVTFVMGRDGRVLTKKLIRSSGNGVLDQEASDLLERAQPLPKPPSDMPGETFSFSVPVNFNLTR